MAEIQIQFAPTLDPTKKQKCEGHRCRRQATTTDYRPSYRDEDGDWDSFGKVLSCARCTEKTHEAWNGLPEED